VIAAECVVGSVQPATGHRVCCWQCSASYWQQSVWLAVFS